eukprot:CAMPEP_0117605314 /NCGR_PEP_ID=MMETSP0784-20121206/79131_1 /TAXON_ID=39447 /ORGANISM="" /LENGTH=166 /DNA_ID=CAMNT_0005408357 /DNA_START=48 /DNA_END=548 /DNA_ORIENTATION=-
MACRLCEEALWECGSLIGGCSPRKQGRSCPGGCCKGRRWPPDAMPAFVPIAPEGSQPGTARHCEARGTKAVEAKRRNADVVANAARERVRKREEAAFIRAQEAPAWNTKHAAGGLEGFLASAAAREKPLPKPRPIRSSTEADLAAAPRLQPRQRSLSSSGKLRSAR